jgi:hypothetical protein
LVFALARAGSSMAARIAMIAITTNSSMSVKPQFFRDRAGVTVGSSMGARIRFFNMLSRPRRNCKRRRDKSASTTSPLGGLG